LTVRTCDTDYFGNGATKYSPANDYPRAGSTINAPDSEILFFIIFKNHLVTCHNRPISHVHTALRKLSTQSTALTSPGVVQSLLGSVVGEYQPVVKDLEADVAHIDEQAMFFDENVQKTMGNIAFLQELKRVRRQLMYLQRLLKPKTKLLKMAASAPLHTVPLPDGLFNATFETQERLAGMLEDLEGADESLTRSHTLYLSWISIQQAEFSNNTNIQMQRLTVFAALGIPITVVSSMWGMNVTVPFETVGGVMASWSMLGPFIGIVFCSLLLTGILWFSFKKFKYY